MAAIGRFQKGDDIFYAKVVDGEIFRVRGDVFGSPSFDKKPVALKGVRTLTPVAPSKVIAVGLNYADHAREQNKPLPKEPLIWLKAPTSLIPDGGKIEVPFPNHRTDFEAELCIVIGRRVRNVTPAAASRYIFGYTAAEDISDRTIQNSETQYARAKSFDTFTPLGPYVETKIDPHDLTIQLFQNGQLRQNSNTNQLIFNCYPARELHLDQPDPAAGRHHSHGHAERRRADSLRRPAGSADRRVCAAAKHGEVGDARGEGARDAPPPDISASPSRPSPPTLRGSYALVTDTDTHVEGDPG